jgi:16S rRNA (adenine1518-N6/adenine1519-N6)-dimethyltransferase
MVQREVADRVVAPPGRLSLLGVSVQYYAHASVEARVPAGAFFPVPKVDSAILKLVPYRHPAGSESEAFFRLVRAGFSMPRKQLANSLSAGLDFDRGALSTVLAEAGIDGKRRAETLSVTEWLALTAAIESTGHGA